MEGARRAEGGAAMYRAKATLAAASGVDKNKDGMLDKAELTAATGSHNPAARVGDHVDKAEADLQVLALFALADVNGDGLLNEGELALFDVALEDKDLHWRHVHAFDFVDAGVADLVKQADADGNGQLSRGELMEAFTLFGTIGGGGGGGARGEL